MAKKGASSGGILDLLSWAVGLSENEESRLLLVPLNEIVVDQNQPRRYFDTSALTQLASSIRSNGVIEPIIVYKLEDGRYQLIAGERRWRAAHMAGSHEIPAIVAELSRKSDIKKFQLIENLMRADLSPLEEVYAYLDLLAPRLNNALGSKKLLNGDIITRRVNIANSMRRLAKLERDQLTPEDASLVKVFVEVFREIGQFSWQEFVAKRLPLINLAADLLAVLHEGKISYAQARLLSRLNERIFSSAQKAINERQKLITWIKKNKPTLAEVRERVNERCLSARDSGRELAPPTFSARLNSAARRLHSLKRATKEDLDSKLQQKLEKYLVNLEKLVDEVEQSRSSSTNITKEKPGQRKRKKI